VLPNGREIEPVGNWIPLAPYPFALAIRPDGAQAAVPSIGFPFALNIVDGLASSQPQTRRFPETRENDPAVEVDAGVAYSPDGKLLYVSTGDSGKVRVYSTNDWKLANEASLDGLIGGKEFERSFAASLAISHDGKLLFVIDEGNWRVVVRPRSRGDGHCLAVRMGRCLRMSLNSDRFGSMWPQGMRRVREF